MNRRYVRAQLASWSWDKSVELAIFEVDQETKRIYVAHALTMDSLENGGAPTPTCRIEQTEAQELMDSLWQCGFRPSEGTGSAGSLLATEKHLTDMQKMAFQMLDKVLK